MNRRQFLVTGAASVGGCMAPASVPEDSPTQTRYLSPQRHTHSPTEVRRTADGVAATFRLTGGRTPSEESTEVQFDGQEVTVTGTIDPEGCNRPRFESVGYDPDTGRVELVVGEYLPEGLEDAECGNGYFDFRSVVTVDDGEPRVVELTYDHPTVEDRTFTVEKD
jgi:hypothetical protein